MKKKYYLIILTVLTAGLTSSCTDQLDSDKYFEDRVTIESVFKDKTRIKQWLANAYSYLMGSNIEITSKDGSTNPFCFADDMYYGDRDKTIDATKGGDLSYNMFKLGEYDENSYITDAWGNCYKGIYQASVFIHNIDQCPESVMEDWEKLDYKGQARFVRAYYYWLLLRRYGPVPIMPDKGVDYTLSYQAIATPRSSYEEVAEFISNEMVQAAKELQNSKYTNADKTGRATRGAALATRAYALIFAASPFANGNNDAYAQQLVDDQGRRLLSQEYKEEKWAKAAAACRDVIELGAYSLYKASVAKNQSGYGDDAPTVVPAAKTCKFANKSWPDGWADIDPLKSYQRLFNGEVQPSANPELIFTRGNTRVDDLVNHQLPKEDGGWNTHGMTQKMVDAYYMNDGTNCPGKDKEIGRNTEGSNRLEGFTTEQEIRDGNYPELSGVKAAYASGVTNNSKKIGVGISKQYVNREPRFYASVAYNGSTWSYTSQADDANASTRLNTQAFYYFGNSNGYRNDGFYLRTGIGIKKFVHPYDYPGKYKIKAETAIRYADILLLYAEALNELTPGATFNINSWYGTTYSISRVRSELEKGIHPVRIRAGLPDYEDEAYETPKLMRANLKRERMIELMGEGKRYFDLRRWKDAPAEESLQVYGCNVYMPVSKKKEFHTPIAIPNLPSTFSEKLWLWPIKHSELQRNPRLTQNPGWTRP